MAVAEADAHYLQTFDCFLYPHSVLGKAPGLMLHISSLLFLDDAWGPQRVTCEGMNEEKIMIPLGLQTLSPDLTICRWHPSSHTWSRLCHL